jgi:hypothetical protein
MQYLLVPLSRLQGPEAARLKRRSRFNTGVSIGTVRSVNIGGIHWQVMLGRVIGLRRVVRSVNPFDLTLSRRQSLNFTSYGTVYDSPRTSIPISITTTRKHVYIAPMMDQPTNKKQRGNSVGKTVTKMNGKLLPLRLRR